MKGLQREENKADLPLSDEDFAIDDNFTDAASAPLCSWANLEHKLPILACSISWPNYRSGQPRHRLTCCLRPTPLPQGDCPAVCPQHLPPDPQCSWLPDHRSRIRLPGGQNWSWTFPGCCQILWDHPESSGDYSVWHPHKILSPFKYDVGIGRNNVTKKTKVVRGFIISPYPSSVALRQKDSIQYQHFDHLIYIDISTFSHIPNFLLTVLSSKFDHFNIIVNTSAKNCPLVLLYLLVFLAMG